jgi:hypothetical protein
MHHLLQQRQGKPPASFALNLKKNCIEQKALVFL